MKINITHKNLYLLLPGKVIAVASIYAKMHHVTLQTAVNYFYKSNTYRKLEQPNTLFWHYGAVALYEELMENN